MSFLEELEWRGQLHQTTGDEELKKHLLTPGRIAYCGFDPTSNSLTIGNLIPIILLMRWQRAGHKPIVVMGGGTGLIGDPSGKDAERQLLDREQVEANIAGQRPIFERLLDFDASKPNAARIVNNADWLTKLGYIEVLRDIGKHFSVNAMIQKDSVRERLLNREQGISYTEFSYQLLQAYDFLHLKQTIDCTVQMAGSDQYGNIVAGIDLIRRRLGRESSDEVQAFGITTPLVTRSDGKKIGKTEKGAVWLTADKTTPYAFYQFWINTEDADVVPFLKWYTFIEKNEIENLARRHAEAPHERVAQRELARHMTELLHGKEALSKVEFASHALFTGNVRELSKELVGEVFADVPHSQHDSALLSGEGLALTDLLPQTSLVSSKREARQFLSTGAVTVNGAKVEPDYRLTTRDLLHGETILIRRGKKNWHAAAFR
jgi:tyrosyl-tRNA synthetase